MIHICFGLHDKNGRYSKFTGTAIYSLFANTDSEVMVHILHDNTLTLDNREKFIYLAGRYGQTIKFYNVEELCAEKFQKLNSLSEHFNDLYSPAANYRFLIAQILPSSIDRVIYVDADIIVNLDIEELWRIKLAGRPLAAVPVYLQNASKKKGLERAKKMFRMCDDGGVKPEDYFNSGIMLMNLTVFRDEEKILMDTMQSVATYPEYAFLDQDVMNYCFAARAMKLSVKFNRAVRYERLEGKNQADKKIYHYAGHNSVWSFNLDMKDAFNRLWFDYYMKTPWFDLESIRRLYESVKRLHISLKNALVNISAAISGKTRVFFTLPENLGATKEVFAVKKNEEIILADSEESLRKLLGAMKNSQGKKIFFIMVTDFPFDVLKEAGFSIGQDFVNGFEFLSEVHGFPLDSHKLITAM